MYLLFGFLLICTTYFFAKISKSLWHSRQTWKLAKLNNIEFLQKYSQDFLNCKIGCSFAPEMWNIDEIRAGLPLQALKIIVEDLKIKDIRLGLRWSEVTNGTDEINLSYYKPILDYCFSKKVRVCLNIGPIKTFRWPEEHIPQYILDKLEKPFKRYSKVHINTELSIYTSNYLESLLKELQSQYSQKQLSNISIIQLENEGFNRMGTFKLKVTKSYLENIVIKANSIFPNAKILVNSPGRFNLKQIVKLFNIINSKNKTLNGKLLIGYDYYYRTEFRDKFFLTKMLDSMHFSLPWEISIKKLIKLSKKKNFQTEITEAQFEPWGKYLGPGNSVIDFKFILLRSLELLNIDTNDQNIIRLWGIENFVKKIINKETTKEHLEIISIIININNYSL